jgi:hypothetical protein
MVLGDTDKLLPIKLKKNLEWESACGEEEGDMAVEGDYQNPSP